MGKGKVAILVENNDMLRRSLSSKMTTMQTLQNSNKEFVKTSAILTEEVDELKAIVIEKTQGFEASVVGAVDKLTGTAIKMDESLIKMDKTLDTAFTAAKEGVNKLWLYITGGGGLMALIGVGGAYKVGHKKGQNGGSK